MTGNKHKSPLLPIEYEEQGTEAAYDEMIFEKITFTEDFGPIKKGSYYDAIYISLDLGYIVLSNDEEDYDKTYDIEFKIKE
jgi:hypothetical protein